MAFLRFPRMLSNEHVDHVVKLFDLVILSVHKIATVAWFVVATVPLRWVSSLLHVINANERMHSHGFSQQSFRRFVFCNLLYMYCTLVFCIKPARWITWTYHVRASVLNFKSAKKTHMFIYFLFLALQCLYCLQRSFGIEQIVIYDRSYDAFSCVV